MFKKRYRYASLKPSALPPGDDDPSWLPEEVLLEDSAYISDECNYTTAFSETREGTEMQATFFLARPPLVSYFSICCTNQKPPEFASEPMVIALEGNLALIIFAHGSPLNCNSRTKHGYYIYRAPVSDGGRPLLKRLQHPKPGVFLHYNAYYFHNDQVGLLGCRTTSDDALTLGPRRQRQGYDSYIVAALCSRCTGDGQYDLYTYHSDTETWDRKPAVLLDNQHGYQIQLHRCEMVITVGGDNGTMGWVDLRRGIVLCDLLADQASSTRQLRYIPLPEPEPIQPGYISDSSQRFRDIAVVKGHIKYVELHIHIRPGSGSGVFSYISDGWTAITWSTAAAGDSGWCKHHKVHASDIIVPVGIGVLLPTLPWSEEKGTNLQRLHIGHPSISWHDDDIVYFKTKVSVEHMESWVIAVDMKKKRLQRVANFTSRKTAAMGSCYKQTTISKYLAPPGTKGNMKRPAMLFRCSSLKKLHPDILHPGYEISSGQKVQNARVERADDKGDHMDLE